MKRILTLLATIAVACSLVLPVYAGAQKETAAPKTATHGKAHKKHARKKGAKKGKKEGQEGTNPGAEAPKK